MSIIAYSKKLIAIVPATPREKALANRYGVRSAMGDVFLIVYPTYFVEKEFENAMKELACQTALPGFDVSGPITASGQSPA